MLRRTPAELLPPSLDSLSTILRDQSLWPRDFHWDFASYYTCAMGLSQSIWGFDSACKIWNEAGDRNRRRIFFKRKIQWWGSLPIGYNQRCVTPEDVADRIDRALGR